MRLTWVSLVLGIMMAGPLHAQAPAPTVQTPPAAPVQRPVGDFAKLPTFADPSLSPDGQSIAAQMAVGGRQLLVVSKLYENTKPVVIGLTDIDLVSWSWVNNDWLILRIGNATKFEGETIYVTRVVGVSAKGLGIRKIQGGEGGQSSWVVWTASDGSPRVLVARQNSLYVGEEFWPEVASVDVSTGKASTVVAPVPNVMRWYADMSGAVRMGIGFNDDRLSSRLLYRDGEKGLFRTIDRARQAKKESLTVPMLLGPGEPAVTIASPGDFDGLYELDLKTLTLGKRIWGVPGYDIDFVRTNPLTGKVEGVGYTTDRARMHWMDPALEAVQSQLDKAVGANRVASIVSMNADRKQLVVQVGEPGQPGAYYLYNAGAGGAMQRYAWVNDVIKGAALSPVSSFRYKARDGQEIEAILTLPRGRDAKNLPLILMPHGGPEARDLITFDWWAQFLADRGYAVVQPNYRGSTGYGDSFLAAGDGQWGLKMQDDLNDAVDDLAKRGVIDAKRVCIVGASYGGYAALRGAQRDGARYRCAVSYAGVADINGMLKYDSQFLNGNAARNGWRESAPDLKAVSPINFPEQFSTPVLLMHGKADLRVPVAQSRRMADKLKSAGKLYEYVEQPEGDHHFSREADRLQFLQTLEAFLNKYNPA